MIGVKRPRCPDADLTSQCAGRVEEISSADGLCVALVGGD